MATKNEDGKITQVQYATGLVDKEGNVSAFVKRTFPELMITTNPFDALRWNDTSFVRPGDVEVPAMLKFGYQAAVLVEITVVATATVRKMEQ